MYFNLLDSVPGNRFVYPFPSKFSPGYVSFSFVYLSEPEGGLLNKYFIIQLLVDLTAPTTSRCSTFIAQDLISVRSKINKNVNKIIECTKYPCI